MNRQSTEGPQIIFGLFYGSPGHVGEIQMDQWLHLHCSALGKTTTMLHTASHGKDRILEARDHVGCTILGNFTVNA